jgi:hypothetical protein
MGYFPGSLGSNVMSRRLSHHHGQRIEVGAKVLKSVNREFKSCRCFPAGFTWAIPPYSSTPI